MNWETLRNRTESTPFKSVVFGNYGRVDLYWSARSGTYGHQVYAAVCFTGSERETVFIKSGGCGYCKEDHVMAQAIKIMGAAPIKTDLDNPDFWRYRLGGNFHKVPQSKMRAIK